MVNVLISPWGSYERWQEVEYCLNNNKMKSKTSFSLLFNIIKPEKTFIVVLDTVAIDGKSYDELVQNVRNWYIDFIERELNLDIKNIEIIVAPGVGDFKNGIFRGNMKDFYAYTLYSLAKQFPCAEDDTIGIHLDITHGFNYTPTLTYKAVSEIASIISLSKDVKLKVYNSEPFVQGVKTLRIHIVEETSINPISTVSGMTSNVRLLEPLDLTNEERQKLFREDLGEIKEVLEYKTINAFLSSIVNGLPLLLYSTYPDVEKMKRCLDLCGNVYKEYINVQGNDKLKVQRRLYFNENFVTLTKAFLIAKSLRLAGKTEVSLRELHEVREKLFTKNSKLNSQISRDLSEIREKIESLGDKISEIKAWTPYRNILSTKLGEPNLRNFFAHSGLEYNVIEIEVDHNILEKGEDLNDAIKVRYSKEYMNKVIDIAQKGL